MNFFIDQNQLPEQQIEDGFGPVTGNLTNQFKVTSEFQLTNISKAFACQDSLMIVQQSTADDSLVNVILKPIKSLQIPFQIKYFIYRGLSKSSFIVDSVIKPADSENLSEFISTFWNNWNNYKSVTNQPSLPDPEPGSIGYNNSLLGTLNLDNIYDNSQEDTWGIVVKEGMWLGDFSTNNKIGFEVILETQNLSFNLDYLRAENQQIDVAGLSGLELKAKREQLLSYIDPATFFGLHYSQGVNVVSYESGTKLITKKKQDELYNLLLINFATKNCVYLDIRSEQGLSYNFYNNYQDDNGNNIKLGEGLISPAEQVYSLNEWPIMVINNPQESAIANNIIKVNLRIDDNLKPILYFEDTSILGNSNNACFIDENSLLNGTDTEWSNTLSFIYPNIGAESTKNNIPYYIKLYYFRQALNPDSPVTVLKKASGLDNLFGSLDMNRLGDINYAFQRSEDPSPNFINGQVSSGELFGHVANRGAQYDSTNVAFYTNALFANQSSGKFYIGNNNTNMLTGISLDGSANQLSFLSKDIGINAIFIQDTDITLSDQEVKILDAFAYRGTPSSVESFFLLYLTITELQTLKATIGLSDLHPRYIVFEEISPTSFVAESIPEFSKYKLKIQGLDTNGNSTIISPSSDVIVYTTRGFIFSSAASAAGVSENQLANNVIYDIDENGDYPDLPDSSPNFTDASLDTPSDPFDPSTQLRKIAFTAPRIGTNEDMDSNPNSVYANPSGIPNYNEKWAKMSDNDLFDKMTFLMHFFTTADEDMRGVEDKMIARFRNRIGGTFSDPVLDTSLTNSAQTGDFLRSLALKIDTALKANNGDINKVGPFEVARPVYILNSYNLTHGLGIIIHDTESAEVYLENGSFSIEPNGKWQLTVTMIVYDHFGLDKPDVLKFPLASNFAAWWTLQHKRGYKPFITKGTIRYQMHIK